MGEVGGIAIIADSQGAGRVTTSPDALRFIIAVKDGGIHVAAGVFDADISGRDLAQGKPHPEIFLTGERRWACRCQECFVVEDAVSGHQAAKAGGMAALGLSRAHDEDLLAVADPDAVVASLDHFDLDAVAEGRWLRGAPDRRRSRPTEGNSRARPARRRRARAGGELQLYLGRCRTWYTSATPHPRSRSCARLSNSCFRVNARHLSEWSKATPVFELPKRCASAAIARGIDRPIWWSRLTEADLKAPS